MALLGDVVAALQQASVDLGMRAAVDRQQRLQDRLDRRLAWGGDQAPGQAIPDAATMGADLFVCGDDRAGGGSGGGGTGGSTGGRRGSGDGRTGRDSRFRRGRWRCG
jgi:hypothetical protein